MTDVSTAIQAPVVVEKSPRCSDFDEDCAEVKCHISCWLGGRRRWGVDVYETPPADGFCPYLRPNSKAHSDE